MRPLVIVHANCSDGFGAAWVFNQYFDGEVDFLYAKHGDTLSLHTVHGRDVYMVDFCYSRAEMESIRRETDSFVVLDHHASAWKNCGDLPYCTFDMHKSGAMMAWNYCFPKQLPSNLIQYIQDQDLWKWELPDSQAIAAYIDTFPWVFKEWDKLAAILEKNINYAALGGKSILAFSNLQIKMLCKRQYVLKIGGIDVPTVNTATFRSEVCNALLTETSPVSATYSFNGEKYVFSLRSDGRVDVSELAGKYPGGGGHKDASGFSVDRLEDLETYNR